MDALRKTDLCDSTRLTLDFFVPNFYKIDSLIPEKHIAKNTKSQKRSVLVSNYF